MTQPDNNPAPRRPETEPCPVCGQTAFADLYPVRDTNQGVEGSWRIVQCRNCGLGILSPLPEPDQIASFYRDDFYTDQGERFNSGVERLRARLGQLRGRTLKKLIKPGGRILDFGSGAGHFGAAMKQAGYPVENADLASGASDNVGANRLEMVDGRPRLNYPDGHFEAVTLWYVIEHLLDPGAALAEFNRVLKPGGVLLLSQQNFASLQARRFGPCWLILDPPRHIYQFDPVNLSRLARQTGFEVIQLEHGSLELGPYTILQSTLNKMLGNQNYLFRFLKNNRLRQEARASGSGDLALALVSLGLAGLLGPAALMAHYLLRAVESGDDFTLYLRKS